MLCPFPQIEDVVHTARFEEKELFFRSLHCLSGQNFKMLADHGLMRRLHAVNNQTVRALVASRIVKKNSVCLVADATEVLSERGLDEPEGQYSWHFLYCPN